MRTRLLGFVIVASFIACAPSAARTTVATYNPWTTDGRLLGSLQAEFFDRSTDSGCGGQDWTGELLAGHVQSDVAAGALRCLFAGMDAPSDVNALDPCWPNPAADTVACVDRPGGLAQLARVGTLPVPDSTRRPHPWALQIRGGLICVTGQSTRREAASLSYDCDRFRTRSTRSGYVTTYVELVGRLKRSSPTWTIRRARHREVMRNRKQRTKTRTARVAVVTAWF